MWELERNRILWLMKIVRNVVVITEEMGNLVSGLRTSKNVEDAGEE